jgi:hypothetical protein
MCVKATEEYYIKTIKKLKHEVAMLKGQLAEYGFRKMDDGK